MNVYQIAFFTSSTLVVLTGKVLFTAITVTSSIITKIACGVLALLFSMAAIASVTAWLHPDSTNKEAYVSRFQKHVGFGINRIFQLFFQTF